MLNFCTLFDINFATQGVVMYESLKEHCSNFHFYIFAFCDESYSLLKKLNLEHVTVISLNEFEDEELLRVKPLRTKGEYCWTCSSSAVLYCLKQFNLPQCTYVDADLYFYSNPKVLLNEMGNKSVLITEHRYTPQYDQTATSGKYCVQFISFKNDARGLEVLNWWRNACLKWCYARYEDGKFGDQKYLDDWTERFKGIHVLEHLGGGVAPWNIHQYEIFKQDKKLRLVERNTKKETDIVFYHFHDIKILDDGFIDFGRYILYDIGEKNQKLIHNPYLNKLRQISEKLYKQDKKIILVKGIKIDYKKLINEIRKKIITIRFSTKKPELSMFGVKIIK